MRKGVESVDIFKEYGMNDDSLPKRTIQQQEPARKSRLLSFISDDWGDWELHKHKPQIIMFPFL